MIRETRNKPVLDLVIRGGTIVTAEDDPIRKDIGIADGRIAAIGEGLDVREEVNAREVLDVSDKLVLPGGIDAHVHLTSPREAGDEEPGWVDDFTSGSAAALAGGITTLGNMTFPLPGETPFVSLARERVLAEQQAIADIFLHPVIGQPGPEVQKEIPDLLEAGCNSIKLFTVWPWFDARLRDCLELVRQAGEQGLITLIHCEDRTLIDDATQRLVMAGRTSMRYYPESRTVISEVVAVQRAVSFAEATGAPVYIVHLSSADALDVCIRAQSRGLPVYVETRPLYLHLTRERFEEPDGAKYVGQPPLRDQSDLDALWKGLSSGIVQTVCTDHAPWTLAAKLDKTHTLGNLRPGVANLQTMLPMLYSEGVRHNRISLNQFVAVTSTNASKLFGLYPRKGTIAVGSDADLVVFDPDLTQKVSASMMKSRSDYSAFEGWEVTGWPLITIRRGEVVYRDGEVTGQPGSGQIVRRLATMPL